MSLLSGSRPHGRGARVLVAVLLLALLVTGALGYSAHEAARSHRAAAEQALRDYAAFAAFLFARETKPRIMDAVYLDLHMAESPTLRRSDGALPTPAALVRANQDFHHKRWDCPACPAVDSASYFFRIDLPSGEFIHTAEGGVPKEVVAWVADSLRRVVTDPDVPRSYGAMFRVEPGGSAHGIGYLLRRDGSGRPMYAYGFDAPMEAWDRVFSGVMENVALLPPSLTWALPNDSLLTLVVEDGSGRSLYRSAAEYPFTFSARDTTFGATGGLVVRAALRPDAAEALVIGGLPRSRLPLLGGLLALAAVLIGTAIVQIRRENELARLRADFVSSVSHELRTPLAQIRMFAETLRLGRVRSGEEQRRSVEIIDQEAKRLTHLVDNVLLFSRAERQASRLCPEPTELAPLVGEVTEMFGPLAAAKQVRVESELEPGVVAPVDRDAMQQVLLNLLDNAVKYGPAGQTVTVGLERAEGEARLRVDDQGPGVPPRERRRVFDAFSRLDREASSAIAGSGIGLSVVRELVELHGGRVWMTEAPGGGARCVIALPYATARGRRRTEEPAAGVVA